MARDGRREHQQVILTGSENVGNVPGAPGDDAWDRWNYDRLAQLGEPPRSAQYVPPDVAGRRPRPLRRLARQPRYGNVWVPRDVSADWAPYSTGRWV